MHHADPGRECVARRGEVLRAPAEPHRARVFGVDAGDDLHQRRFAGAVLADQAVDFAGCEGEIHPAQRRDAAERF